MHTGIKVNCDTRPINWTSYQSISISKFLILSPVNKRNTGETQSFSNNFPLWGCFLARKINELKSAMSMCVCPFYMSCVPLLGVIGTWVITVSGKEIWDFGQP